MCAHEKTKAMNVCDKEIFEWLCTAILRGASLDMKCKEYGERFWEGCMERLELLKRRTNVAS